MKKVKDRREGRQQGNERKEKMKDGEKNNEGKRRIVVRLPGGGKEGKPKIGEQIKVGSMGRRKRREAVV